MWTTSSHVLPLHLSSPWFESSLNVKVMGSNPGYLLKSFLTLTNLVCRFLICNPYKTLSFHSFLQAFWRHGFLHTIFFMSLWSKVFVASMMQHFSFGLNSPATQPLKTAQKCVFIGFCLMAIIDCFYVSWAINGDDISLGVSSMAVCFYICSTNVMQLSNQNP